MHNTMTEPYSPLLRVYTEQMSHFGQWTNQAETLRLSIDSTLGTVSRFSKATSKLSSKQYVLDFNVPNNYREQNQNIFLLTPGEQREQLREKIGKNSHNCVAAICRARGKGVLLSKFTRLIGFLRGWNMKMENISWGGIQGQFWNILNKFFSSTKCHINYTYMWYFKYSWHLHSTIESL